MKSSKGQPNLSAIIVAAGSSLRAGFDKIFAELQGTPVVGWSLKAFEACEAVGEIVVVGRKDRVDDLKIATSALKISKLKCVVAGGDSRQASVWNGIQASSNQFPYISVHDGARPMITPKVIAGCLELAAEVGAASCAAPVTDTLKRSQPAQEGSLSAPVITSGIDRENLWAMQTPQIFRRDLLISAYVHARQNNLVLTDETSALQSHGHPVALFDSRALNPKITYAQDLAMVERLLD